MVSVHHLLCGDALLLSTDGNRYAVLVRATDEYHLSVLQSQETGIDVSWDIHSSQVTYVYSAISIRQGGSNSCSLVILYCHISFI